MTESTKAEVRLAALRLSQKATCSYIGATCDCKYGANSKGEQTGCPEIRDMIAELEAESLGQSRAKAEAKPERKPHTCDMTQSTADGSVPPPCKACQATTAEPTPPEGWDINDKELLFMKPIQPPPPSTKLEGRS